MEKGPEIDCDRSLARWGRKRGGGKQEDYCQQEKLLSDFHGREGTLKEDPDEGPQDGNGRLLFNPFGSLLNLFHCLFRFLY